MRDLVLVAGLLLALPPLAATAARAEEPALAEAHRLQDLLVKV